VLLPRPRTPLTPSSEARLKGNAAATAAATAAAAAAAAEDKSGITMVAPDLFSSTVPPEIKERLDEKGEKGE
jgi:3-oxoacyl-ACP reductase-like protein